MAEKKSIVLPRFPKRFLWGVSTSAHQVEGGTHNQWSVWELENAKSLAKQAEYKLDDLPMWTSVKKEASQPNNYVSGKATDHYNLYDTDFAAVEAMGMNVFRFSIEWSRLEPEMGKWDDEEVTHYRAYLAALKKRKIEPVVTLMHWTLPIWFTQLGGFEKRGNVRYFERFAKKVFKELGADLRYIITFNEPEGYVGNGWVKGEWPPNKTNKLLAFVVYRNIAYAHRRVYKIARRQNRRFKIGLNKNIVHYSRDDGSYKSRLVIRISKYVADYWFLNRVRRHIDWIGINHYFTNHYKDGKHIHQKLPVSDVGWEMEPQNLQAVLERIYNKYKKPLFVTESGVADYKDSYRRWWITHNILAMHRAMERGVRLEGYLHWSLLDNFEWAYGKWPRFGLLAVDYTTYRRTARASAIWFAKVIKQIRAR